MIWEDDPGDQIANQLIQLNIQSLVFQTASNTPEDSDYFDVMKANIKHLRLPE